VQVELGQIITHAIGFLIAVWLLKRYAWSSILGFVEKRRETIAASFDEIEKGKVEIEEQKTHYAREMEKIEQTRREKIQQAADEADKLASDILEEARREAVTTREKAKQDIEIELDKANEILKDRMIEAVFTTTEKLLNERLDKQTHNRLVDEYLAKVNAKQTS
jgi:F-type H+-transporting ATPase subunit b